MLIKKVMDRRGASMILAAFLTLVCGFAAASMIMAASANSGKLVKRNTEEQKYLSLSSAVELVCNELKESSYKGKYSLDVKEISPEYDEDGELIAEGYTKYTYQHIAGEMSGGEIVSRLSEELEWIYRDEFKLKVDEMIDDYEGIDEYSYDSKSSVTVKEPETPGTLHKMKFTVSGSSAPDNLKNSVTEMELALRKNYDIKVTAWISGDKKYKMEALLKATASGDILLGGRSKDTYTGRTVSWSLSSIEKK